MEYLKQIVLLVALVLAIRSFVIEPFKIPSGSMIPTLLVGDYVLVSKFSYGLRLPFTGALVLPLGKPKRGEVIVFRYPDDPRQDFIKRVVGLPGDEVAVRNGRVEVNGEQLENVAVGEFVYTDFSRSREVTSRCIRERSADAVEYVIVHQAGHRLNSRHGPWIVPPDKYFVMGDNRDNSRDSRLWHNPFVTAHQIKGRAFRIHWSWVVDSGPPKQRDFLADLLHTLYQLVTFQIEEVRWGRIGRAIGALPECSLAAAAGEVPAAQGSR